MSRAAVNMRGLKCPLPALKTRKLLAKMAPGEVLVIECTDPLTTIDIPNLLRETGDSLDPERWLLLKLVHLQTCRQRHFNDHDRSGAGGDGRPVRFCGVARLVVNNGMIFLFLVYARRDLPAEIAIDACVVDKEVTGGVLRVRAL